MTLKMTFHSDMTSEVEQMIERLRRLDDPLLALDAADLLERQAIDLSAVVSRGAELMQANESQAADLARVTESCRLYQARELGMVKTLAEKEAEIERLTMERNKWKRLFHNMLKVEDKLRHQLAEREKEKE